MDDFIDESLLSTIVNSYDYSNALVGKEQLIYIIDYIDSINNNFLDIVNKEEQKNEQVKHEYRKYDFKKNYNTGCKIMIRNGNIGYKTFEDIKQFKNDLNSGILSNLECVKIEFNLSFKRGIGNDLNNYSNEFILDFKPYDITFTRKSDHNVMIMNKLEDNIKSVMDQLPTINTIFCSKGE